MRHSPVSLLILGSREPHLALADAPLEPADLAHARAVLLLALLERRLLNPDALVEQRELLSPRRLERA